MSTTSAYISSTFHFMKSVIWLWDSIGTIHVTGKFSTKDNWSETLIPGKLASRLIRGKNSVNSTIGRKILSELTVDPTYVNPTYPRFVVLNTIHIIRTAAFCPCWAKIRLIRGLLYIYIYMDTHLLWLHMELKAASANMSVIQNELRAQDHLMLNVSRAYHNNSVLQRLNVRCLASVLFHCRSRDLSSSREPTHWPVRSETWEYSPCVFSITNTYILQVYWLQLHQY